MKSFTIMQNVLNLRRVGSIKMEGKIIIFEKLGPSKIVYLTSHSDSQLKKHIKYKKPLFGTTWLLKSNINLCVPLFEEC